MGSVSVSSCRCCMFVSCVHPVVVLNAAFCMTRSLLMLVEDAIGDHTEVPIPKPNKDTDKGTSYRPIFLLSVIAKTLE